jgi:hypothetical protein
MKAIDLIIYAESLLQYRRVDRFIHRRALLNFELAKIYYTEEDELSQTLTYLDEARELFERKQQLNPSSSYSYYDYINLLMWELEKIEMDDEDASRLQVKIEDNFNLAYNSITEGRARIATNIY